MTQTIIVPIRNLKLYGQIKIGNVQFIPSAESVNKEEPYSSELKKFIISIKEGVEKKKSALSSSSTAEEERWLAHIESFLDCSLAVYESNHDDNKDARKDAEQNIERSLNVLRFYLSHTMGDETSRLDPISLGMFMAMEGLAYTDFTIALGIKPDGNTHIGSTRTGYVRPYEITAEIMRRIEGLYLDKLNNILLKPEEKRSPFEKSLLTSIDFYGYGMNEYNYRNRFVSFIISLESILLVKKERKAVLAERAAIILGSSSDARQRVHKRINDLYEIRSKIVHEGKDEVTLQEIRSLSSTVFEILVKLINYSGKINDKTELKKEVNKLKYSAPAFEL